MCSNETPICVCFDSLRKLLAPFFRLSLSFLELNECKRKNQRLLEFRISRSVVFELKFLEMNECSNGQFSIGNFQIECLYRIELALNFLLLLFFVSRQRKVRVCFKIKRT